jgi:hypothetical protein
MKMNENIISDAYLFTNIKQNVKMEVSFACMNYLHNQKI